MDNLPEKSPGLLSFSDEMAEQSKGKAARLSLLSFDHTQIVEENSSTFNVWSKRFTPDPGLSSPPLQDLVNENEDQSSIDNATRRALRKSIIWPVLMVVVPICLVSAVLLGLICGYNVKTQESLFEQPTNSDELSSSTYILVNYSATRLVFLASWLSTLAPILAGFVMILWSLPIAETMRKASIEMQPTHLPTPYQLSLVIGLSLASLDRLRRYFSYVFSRSRPAIPPVLHHAALMLTLCLLLASAVFVADTAIHYYTETVPFNQVTVATQSLHEYGHGLSEECLDFNRTEWFCLPCSTPMWKNFTGKLDAIAAAEETFFLQRNTSQTSEVRIIEEESFAHGDLAVLTPQTANVPAELDYRASTVAISTQCSPMIMACNPTRVGNNQFDTQFNCSTGFWGVLGRPPILSDTGENTNQSADPDVPPLNFKPFLNLQWGYYVDPNMTIPYDTGAYNITTGQQLLDSQCVPDNQLQNPVYFGIAGRFDEVALSAASNLSLEYDSGMLKGLDTYVDFVLNCSYTTYDVNYTWVNGAVQDASFSPSPNGTLAEMFHGSQLYTANENADSIVEDILQAALESTSDAFAREFANRNSVRALSVIGPYTSERSNFQEQTRKQILVARLPKIALGALLAFSLAYVVLGLALGIAAFVSSSSDIRDLAARLSVAGLAAAAFEEKDGSGTHQRIIKDPDEAFSSQEDGTRRVGVEGLTPAGYILDPWTVPVSASTTICQPSVPSHGKEDVIGRAF